MPVAATERPRDREEPTLLEEAERLAERNPGYRVEILGGQITVTPPPDAFHALSLTDLTYALKAAHTEETSVVQGVAVWLPDGPYDYAIPDLSVVDGDADEHAVESTYYDPAVFRLVLEVTSTNYAQDVRTKVAAYAIAKIPVYVIVDRKKQRLHVLTDPFANEYRDHRVYAPGERAELPESIGATIELDVNAVLEKAGRRS
ncbi:Uma2 family endonuclease [Streptomyces mobaraensis]|uniref:Uma2 family endonuclease n=1 Tax=Streptomyces mobaraensis TaxID=35621 RepID=A0A5N5WEQ1_STRMB|nr:Uma2 family endonuclease [Streptomyces mobaraensis]KAB7852405.1 Uma2 family endonuclease [Streptomyces mobaraensis]